MTIPEGFNQMEPGFDYGQAFAEASRCLLCYDAPCSKACPGGTDPGTFIRKFRFHNVKGAIRTIKENNILGGACGVLCPTMSLCEKECSCTGLDRPIRIGKIQRFLIEHSWEIGYCSFETPQAVKAKAAVVGSGPAGLSCAACLANEGYRVTVFEARAKPGGVLAYGVPTYRFSNEFLEKEIDDLRTLGVEFVCSTPIRGPGAVEKLLDEGFAAVFLAPGCWEPIRLKKDDQEIPGLFTATDFLAALREERYDELSAIFGGKDVAVMGGGSVAMDCVGSALRLGARDVYLVYRRSYAQMPAEEDERIDALEGGAHFILLNQPVDYLTDDEGSLSALKLVRTRLGDEDTSGRRRPVEIPGSEWVLEVSAAIEAFGSRPASDSPNWYPSVEVDRKNLIAADLDTGKTTDERFYAGGDIVRGPALVIKAIQDGKTAAKSIIEYLREQEVSK